MQDIPAEVKLLLYLVHTRIHTHTHTHIHTHTHTHTHTQILHILSQPILAPRGGKLMPLIM